LAATTGPRTPREAMEGMAFGGVVSSGELPNHGCGETGAPDMVITAAFRAEGSSTACGTPMFGTMPTEAPACDLECTAAIGCGDGASGIEESNGA